MSSIHELNNHLFAALDRLDVENMTPEQIETEVACAAAPDLARAYIAQAAEITRLRAQVEAGDNLAEAVSGLIAILDRNDTKGPIPDIEMMFCWMAAQDVRAHWRRATLNEPLPLGI
jgi:hypothetical protein